MTIIIISAAWIWFWIAVAAVIVRDIYRALIAQSEATKEPEA